jgi:hypothetical protein
MVPPHIVVVNVHYTSKDSRLTTIYCQMPTTGGSGRVKQQMAPQNHDHDAAAPLQTQKDYPQISQINTDFF